MERKLQLEMRWSSWVDLLGRFWCRHFHRSLTWPIHGKYECSTCGRAYSVPWDARNPIHARPSLEVATELWPKPVPKLIFTAPGATGPRRFGSLSAEPGEDAA
jgi:hypothetical protein